jgi:Ras-related protein Rab-1A
MTYDVTVRTSFEHVKDWLADVQKYARGDTSKMLIGNKCDRQDRVVATEEGVELGRELQMPFLETSARTSENVEAAFMRLAEQLIKAKAAAASEEASSSSVDIGAKPRADKAGGACC